ncbi:hypothetical protein D8Z70_23775 [Escherichia coli]|uniref:gp53-like domain-containing protein n=1 Tax=Escherichia coli TaxID=562 RepID=UPI00124C9BAB|nr:hypothetical protein [Escherichia coli]QFH16559.1 hypothetical protein D8Z70_23775 [Escherichia coli]
MAKNDFKAFATDRNANVMSQEEWEALPALISGFTAGKASSAQVNKVIRQASFIAAALAQFVSDKTQRDVLDNGDLPGFVELLGSGFAVEYLSRKNPFGDIKSDGTVKTALQNLGLGEAAKRDVGTGENQIPDMASFASGNGWMKLPNGKILQYGRGAVTPTLSTQTMRITFSILSQKADCAMLTHSGDGGAPLGAGEVRDDCRRPTLTGFNSAYRTSSTSDTVSMNYSWWAVGE